MKRIYLFFIVFWICSCSQERKNNTINLAETPVVVEKRPEADLSKLKIKAAEALKFCASKNLNKDFCILIDMSLHSGVNRFFIWDFKNNTVSKKYLVGHGCGSNAWSKDDSKANPGFSKTEAIFLLWENISLKEEVTATGESISNT